MNVVESIFEIFRKKGSEMYLGEPVTQLQHALQAAHLAEHDGADGELIAAALLHDFGHLIADDESMSATIDARHEQLGAEWLSSHFPEAVWMPVRLHVAAKRYLCATNPSYLGRLSAASLHSLRLQGGPMSAGEVDDFERSAFWRSALRLRLWDEEAKDPNFEATGLERYRELLSTLARLSIAAEQFRSVSGVRQS
jgi:phosphonate degradation associated HDIG domain protein